VVELALAYARGVQHVIQADVLDAALCNQHGGAFDYPVATFSPPARLRLGLHDPMVART
jgi:hypothetical protein